MAHRAGIEHTILPVKNKKDLADVPNEVKSKLHIDFVNTALDVLKIALDLSVSPVLVHQDVAGYNALIGVN